MLMPSSQLYLHLIQTHIEWENRDANLENYTRKIATIEGRKEVVVLPEMFSTGFSMSPETLAEPMDGVSVRWMAEQAAKNRCIVCGSLMIHSDGAYFNRFLWVQPDGKIGYYDKRHLFGYAGEDKHYTPGEQRQIVSVNGWKINLQVCYDLRFPVWARNVNAEYDVLLYVANWPNRRSLAWKTLLQARAIENQCYVVGVNRVGTDAKNNVYSGDSSVFGPLGELIWQQADEEVVQTIVLEKERLDEVRRELPFLADQDKFLLI